MKRQDSGVEKGMGGHTPRGKLFNMNMVQIMKKLAGSFETQLLIIKTAGRALWATKAAQRFSHVSGK